VTRIMSIEALLFNGFGQIYTTPRVTFMLRVMMYVVSHKVTCDDVRCFS